MFNHFLNNMRCVLRMSRSIVMLCRLLYKNVLLPCLKDNTKTKQLKYFQRELEGYEFPVYSTEFCPRNGTESKSRSSAINCTESNGYMCIPNENLTELLEFCYIYPQIPIEKGEKFKMQLRYVTNGSKTGTYFIIFIISGQ